MPRAAVALAGAILVVVAIAAFVPFITEDRAVPVSTPSTNSMFIAPALIEVPPGERACLDDVLLDPEADIARFRVGTYGFEGPPLALTLFAAGFREDVRVGPGYADNAEIDVALDGPPRELIGTACISNGGRRLIALYGTAEDRTLSRVDVTVDGEPVSADIALSFWERERSTVLARTPEILELMTAFRPIGPWLTWPLLFLVLIGMPALALWALNRAFRADAAAQPNAATSRSASPISRG